MAEVTAPVEDFTGTVVGVQFVDGKGSTDSAPALAYFTRQGYAIGESGLEVFDPSEHTVDEVNDHLGHADDTERERVLQAESEGKARQGILTGPHSDLSGS